jgi:hypothetical protein
MKSASILKLRKNHLSDVIKKEKREKRNKEERCVFLI